MVLVDTDKVWGFGIFKIKIMQIGNLIVHDALVESTEGIQPMRGIIIELEGKYYVLCRNVITGYPTLYILREDDKNYILIHNLLGKEIQYDFLEGKEQVGDLKIVKLVTILPIDKR